MTTPVIPKHIAIIMDGNRTWAKNNSLEYFMGHKKGSETVKDIIEGCTDLGVEYLTLFAFSTENWKRDKNEVSALLSMLGEFLDKEEETLVRKKIRLCVIGDISKFSDVLRMKIERVVSSTSSDFVFTLVLALNYGGRDEITRAVRHIAEDILEKKVSVGEVSEQLISRNLYTDKFPDPDLLIRTGAQKRISNFLLWQISYAELFFTDILWPDFNKECLKNAVLEYQKRLRKFGR